jgi:hypothetical protein
MSQYVKPETLLPSQITRDSLSKAPVGAKPDGTPSASLFKVQVKNSKGASQDVVLQVNGHVSSGIGYWDNATDKFVRDVQDMNSLPLSVTNVNVGVGIEGARFYGTADATESSAQDYATLQAFQTIQDYNVTQAAPAIYQKMPYLPKGTIEQSKDNFINSVVIGEPLVLPDGTPNPPFRVDEKSGRQYPKSLSVSVQLYLKPRVAGKPFEVDNAVLWEIVGWEQLPNGGRKPILEQSRDWVGLLKWGAKGVVKGKFAATSITKDNKASSKFIGSEFFFERSQRGGGAQPETDPNAAAASLVWG